ncbi:hypothetical protein J437_LFUL010156 [Ladona fulva]|uniref:aralkylamine N-acetyltransferase n=1 Tax=Ladona fulva TaxID=123851 RepID=A0A8K0NZW7_LADFU|nr:hypothetical protein J437_LFUL010156 [Ladona fulva]
MASLHLGAIHQEQWFGKKQTNFSNAAEYEILPIALGDAERVLDFLRRFFFRDEPLNYAIGLTTDGRSSMHLEAHCLVTLSHGLSLMAVEGGPTGRIIGVSLNAEGKPGDADTLAVEADRCPDPKFRRILRILETVERNSDVLEKYNADRQLELRIISVDDSCRGRGVASKLLKQTIELGRRRGFPVFRVDCTSAFSAKAMERAGLPCVYSLSYEDYAKQEAERYPEEAQPPLIPSSPHTHVKCYAVKL